jgi:hypothetical protein
LGTALKLTTLPSCMVTDVVPDLLICARISLCGGTQSACVARSVF